MALMNFTKIALKNLFTKPATTNYPFEERQYPERYRGAVAINIDECIMCGLCNRKCPASAITVDKATRTWSIQRMSCVQCSLCVNSCPKKCLSMVQHYTDPSVEKTVDSFSQPIPEGQAPAAGAAASGKPQANKDECVFCTLCAKNCPVSAITVDRADKKWELDDATCIECGACVANCPKKCISMGGAAPSAAPAPKKETPKKEAAKKDEAPVAGKEVTDNKPHADMDECVFCGLCAKNCPKDAISVDRAEKSWKVDGDKCVECAYCEVNCPKQCITMGGTTIIPVEPKAEEKKEEVKAEAKAVVTSEGKPAADTSECVFCGLCAKNCPASAITVDRAAKSWELNEDACLECGMCVESCPKKCIKM